MIIYSANEARIKLDQLIEQASETHKTIYIKTKKSGAVLISEEYWLCIQETLYLAPKVGKSVKKELKAPLRKCSKKLTW